ARGRPGGVRPPPAPVRAHRGQARGRRRPGVVVAMAKLGNLASRVLVAVVAVPLLLLAIYRAPDGVVWGLVFVASLIAMDEFFAIGGLARPERRAAVALGALACAAIYWLPAAAQPAT